jgi:hypothetical protein
LSIVLSSALLLPLIGCGPSAADRLVGRWEGSLQVDQDEVNRQQASAQSPLEKGLQNFALTGLKSMKMTLEFQADGQMAMSISLGPLNESRGGTWEVVRQQSDQVTIKSVDEKGIEQESVLTFQDPDTFLMQPPDGDGARKLGVLRFQRVSTAD